LNFLELFVSFFKFCIVDSTFFGCLSIWLPFGWTKRILFGWLIFTRILFIIIWVILIISLESFFLG
jgi:hypothetical protein